MSRERGEGMNYFNDQDPSKTKGPKQAFWLKRLNGEFQQSKYTGILDSHEKRSRAATDPFLPQHIKQKIPSFEESKRENFYPHTYKLKEYQTDVVPRVDAEERELTEEQREREIDRSIEHLLGPKTQEEVIASRKHQGRRSHEAKQVQEEDADEEGASAEESEDAEESD
mmetsp:Transcript_11411/g.19259  ORF Transcript_11411/g.19259 Transcript_11411/m.19259 type:complete len:169 (-) Transcript_11411:7-513(-)